MSEFTIAVDGEDHELNTENHGIAMFRKTPEFDYIDISVEAGTPEEPEIKHIMIFRHQWLCHWMGGIALNASDQRRLAEDHAEFGSFREQFGWNSKVLIEDDATDFEKECMTESLMGDLRASEGLPESWLDD